MKFSILLVCLLFANLGFADGADNVEVMVNGQVYQCSSGGAVDSCRAETAAALTKNKACNTAGYSAGSCYQPAFTKKIASYTYWSQACNTTCSSAGYSAGSCYQSCFN